jgi:hypothetical protein
MYSVWYTSTSTLTYAVAVVRPIVAVKVESDEAAKAMGSREDGKIVDNFIVLNERTSRIR